MTLIVGLVTLPACSDCDSPRTPTVAPEPEPEPATARQRAIDPPAGPGALGASLSASDQGVLATWIEPRGDDSHVVRFSRLAGESWSPVTSVVEAPDVVANWADFPRAVTGGDGAIYVHWARRSGEAAYAYEVQLTRSRDGGRSFEAMGVVHRDGTPTEHGFVSMVPTDDGARLFWLDGRDTLEPGGATAVYTTTVGASIAEAARLDERVCDCCQTDAAIGADGPLVVYRDRTESEVRDISIARVLEAGPVETRTVHPDGWEMAGCPVNGPAIAAEDARVVVAWFTGAEGGAVHAAFSEDGGESFAEPVTVDAEQPPGRVDVVLVPGGAAVSWLARSGRAAEVRIRIVGVDGTLGAPVTVARTLSERASGFPVLVRDGARLLVTHRDGQDPPRVHVTSLLIADLPRETDDESARAHEASPPIDLGDPIPEASVEDATDTRVTLDALRGEGPLVLAFFARWCQPCREELADLETLRSRVDAAVTVVAVSLDEGPAERAEAVAERWGFDGTVVRDAGAAATLGVPPIPALFVFDEDGILRGAFRGERAPTEEIIRLTSRR